MIKLLKWITEAIAWLQIAASPLLIGIGIGIGIGALVYFSNQTTTRLVIGISIAALGLIIGILWATKIWKTKGTVWFMSRVMASPDLDKKDGEMKSTNTEEKQERS